MHTRNIHVSRSGPSDQLDLGSDHRSVCALIANWPRCHARKTLKRRVKHKRLSRVLSLNDHGSLSESETLPDPSQSLYNCTNTNYTINLYVPKYHAAIAEGLRFATPQSFDDIESFVVQCANAAAKEPHTHHPSMPYACLTTFVPDLWGITARFGLRVSIRHSRKESLADLRNGGTMI